MGISKLLKESVNGPRSRQSGRLSQEATACGVDDDPQVLRYVSDALASAGYTPVVTGDPEEELRLVDVEKPTLVLLDLMLPGTDGIEMMKDILETAGVPVIFLSAYGRDELIARAFDMGAVDYVVKPFSPTELSARIRAALRRRAASEPSAPYVLGDLTIDYAERRVTLAGRPFPFIAMEYIAECYRAPTGSSDVSLATGAVSWEPSKRIATGLMDPGWVPLQQGYNLTTH